MPTSESEQRDLARVPPAAHRRTDFIARWLPRVCLIVVAALALWRVFDHFCDAAPGAAVWNAPGPVADPHALWENNCAACHPGIMPISPNGWAGVRVSWSHNADAQCKTCHAGPDHHAAEKPDDRAGCTACHREHHGRDASLLRMTDDQCIRCHDNLGAHLAAGRTTDVPKVSRFDHDLSHHPEFRVLRDHLPDPGTLAFNHKLHMTPGMSETPNLQVKTDDGKPVRLECQSCHQLDAGDLGLPTNQPAGVPLSAVLPARSPGASMLPIVYEKHCQACHPLTYDRKDHDDPLSGPAAVPHRLQPEEILPILKGYYTAKMLRDYPSIADWPVPLPGKPADPEQATLLQAVDAQAEDAEQELYLSKKGCGECHSLTPVGIPVSPDWLANLRIAPTGVKEVWLDKAAFDHAAHRLLRCEECHDAADASEKSKDVLLPGIATCLKCHGPRDGAVGGARFDCVECHRYHDGDHPLTGKGSAARAGPTAGAWDVPGFVKGKAPDPALTNPHSPR